MTIKLRGHHLLCMLTYIGKGYSEDFIDNYDEIARRLSAGEVIKIIRGTDDICLPLLCEAGAHCHARSVLRRDERALVIVSKILGRPIGIGGTLVPDDALVRKLRAAFAQGEMRKACFGCDWADLCQSVARGGFQEVKICKTAVV